MTDEKVEEKVPDREEEQEEKSSSDEEQAPGELDKPIVILYEKRAKKEVKRFNPVEKEEKTKNAKTKQTPSAVTIPTGKGIALETMAEVVKNFANESDQDLKVIFTVLFGHKRVKLNEVRKTLRKWHGWDVDPDSQEHQLLQEGVGNMTSENLKWAMDVLDISRRGLTKKESLVDKMCEWCMKPQKWSGAEKNSKTPKKEPKTPKEKKTTKKEAKETESPKKKRKAEKDPNKPKKPQSAFFLFLNKNREQFTKKIGSKNPSELAKMASEKWKSMSDSDKAEFTKQGEKLKAEYDIAMEKYNKENNTDTKPKPAKVAKKSEKPKKVDKPKAKEKSPTKKVATKTAKKEEPMPSDKDIEKFLVKLIKKANLEKLTMKQVLSKVAEKYPKMNISTKKSFIKAKVKELIQ